MGSLCCRRPENRIMLILLWLMLVVAIRGAFTDETDRLWNTNVIESFELVNRSLHTASLRWGLYTDYQDIVKDYLLSINGEDTSTMMISSENKVALGGLMSCTTYRFKLYPRDTNKTIIGQSKIISATTYSLASGPVRNVRAYMYSINTVVLEWQKPSLYPECVDKYKLVWSKADNPEFNTTEYETTNRHTLILEPCTKYRATIVAVTHDEIESSPMVFAFTTIDAKPTAVEDVSVVEGGNNNMLIKWKPPRYGQSCVRNYIVEVKQGIGHPKHTIVKYGKQTELETDQNGEINYVVEGIRSCVEYEITIIPMAANISGHPFVYAYDTKPRVFSKPSNGVIKQISSTSVSTAWALNDTKYNSCPLLKSSIICYDSTKATTVSQVTSAVLSADDLVTVKIDHLTPFTTYYCIVSFQNKAGTSQPSNYMQFQTSQDVPGIPNIFSVTDITSKGFRIDWSPPFRTNGLILRYSIVSSSDGLNYKVPSYCDHEYSPTMAGILVPDTVTHYQFDSFRPYEIINVTVSASTIIGFGEPSPTVTIRTKPAASEPVRNYRFIHKGGENFTVLWNQPCYTNGILRYFIVDITSKCKTGSEFSYKKIVGINRRDPGATYSLDLDNLHNEYQYTVKIYPEIINVANSSSSSSLTFIVPASIPPLPTEDNTRKYVQLDEDNVQSNQITVSIDKALFSDQRGEIMYYAILVYRDPFYNQVKNEHMNTVENWPRTENWAASSRFDFVEPYQSTPIRWIPFSGDSAVEYFTVGENGSCLQNDTEICNGPLNSGTSYFIKIRAFTKAGYQDSIPLSFKTAGAFKTAYYFIIAGIIIVICAILSALFYARGIGRFVTIPRKKKTKETNMGRLDLPTDIIPKKFISYCKKFLASATNVRVEFESLCEVSDGNKSQISVANLPINYNKNRYSNILPYDKTRVTIDPETTSDYINASFIRGYNEFERKYIATQGPNLNTCRDFWQMIYQYDVDTIVMLCRIRERNRAVCDKYFPDLNELAVYNDITVECVATDTYQIFTRRRMVILKDGVKKTVNHIHFQDWPDFGTPSSPETLISLCKYVRKINNQNPIVVHCSAGIGRTGTFIACDILLDYIQNNQMINVFNVVLKLRNQRMSMVQSEAQYEYLYKCVAYVLQGEDYSRSLKLALDDVIMGEVNPTSSRNI